MSFSNINKINIESSPEENNNNFININSINEIKSYSSEFWKNLLKLLLELQKFAQETNKKILIDLTDIIIEIYCAQNDIILQSPKFKKQNLHLLFNKINFIRKKITFIQNENNKNKNTSFYINNNIIECVLKGIDMFSWLFSENNVESIKNFYEKAENSINLFLLDKNEKENKYIKIFKDILKENEKFVMKYHKNGLFWANKGDDDITNLILKIGDTYRNNFKKKCIKNDNPYFSEGKKKEFSPKHLLKEIEEIKKRLKPINNNNKISILIESNNININEANLNNNNVFNLSNINNESIFSSSNLNDSFSDSLILNNNKKGKKKSLHSYRIKNYCEIQDNVMLYENFEGINKNLNSDINEETIIKFINCLCSTFKISKPIHKISVIDSYDLKIISNDLFDNVELINNSKIRFHCCGKLKSVNIDGCTDIKLYLFPPCKNIPVYVANSTEIILRLVKENKENRDNNSSHIEDFTDYVIPEQFVYRINDNGKLETNVSFFYS